MRRPLLLLALLLLLPATPAAAFTLDDLFDFASRDFRTKGNRLAVKKQAFDRLLAAKGPAAVVRAMRRVEPGLAGLEKKRNKVYARFLNAHDAYFGWRRKKSDDAEAVPAGINKTFLAAEREIRGVNSIVHSDLAFVAWSLDRLAAVHPSPEGPYLAALLKGIRHKSAHQRLRCIRLLGATTDPAAIKAVQAALAAERYPAVAAALAATGIADGSKALLAEAWTVRAGAIAGFRTRRDRASAVALIPRVAREKGRLADDVHGALAWIAGGEQADWAKWLGDLPADWKPLAYPEKDPPGPETVIPTPSPSGRRCFGLPTGSERVILCVEAGPAWDAVRTEVARYLGTLPQRAEFGIVAYGAGAGTFKKKLVTASGANRAAAAKWMEGVKRPGRSDVYDGLRLAFELADGGARRPARADTIVVVTLQRPTDVGLSPTLVGSPRQIALELARRNALLRVRVLAYGLSGGAQSYYLQMLARPYGGGFRPSGR